MPKWFDSKELDWDNDIRSNDKNTPTYLSLTRNNAKFSTYLQKCHSVFLIKINNIELISTIYFSW